MKLYSGLIILLIYLTPYTYAQSSIEICESTVKIESQTMYEYVCGLAERDKLIFSFDSEKGGKVDRVEILEYPSSIRFTDYKTSAIKQKQLQVSQTGIYSFRFYNNDTKDKVIKFKIDRIPSIDNNQPFNPTVYWRNEKDTTDTYTENQTIVTTDTVITNLVDKMVNIAPWLSATSNRMSFGYTLPPRTIAYSYYIGVNQSGNKAFSDATSNFLRSCSPVVAAIPGYGPLAALALSGTSFFTALSGGESVEYWITDAANSKLFIDGKPFKYIRHGNVVNDFSRITTPLTGDYFICLKNNNKIQSIDATAKVTAVSLRDKKITRPMTKYTIITRRVPYLKN